MYERTPETFEELVAPIDAELEERRPNGSAS